MCVPTDFATAPTFVYGVQEFSLVHTLNVRLLPTTGGPAVATCATAPLCAARAREAARNCGERAVSRKNRSNATATGPRAPCAPPPANFIPLTCGHPICANIAAAAGVADCRTNGAEGCPPELTSPPFDQGKTRYSAVSGLVFAANVTHPESEAGLTEPYCPTARESCDPCAPQDGSWPVPVVLLLQAARIRLLRIVLTAVRDCQRTVHTPR